MKKLGELNLKAEKMLNQEELVNFRGGSGGICPGTPSDDDCQNCLNSVPCACEASCEGDDFCYQVCVINQEVKCAEILCG